MRFTRAAVETIRERRSLAQKVTRQGYFWPTLVKDATDFAKRCESCQRFATLIHCPATSMEPVQIACPFEQWGINILGSFPPATAQKKFIIMAVEYFTKEGDRGMVQGLENTAKFHCSRKSTSERANRETQRIARYDVAKNQEERVFDLTMIEEKRDAAYARILHHKGLMMRSYNRQIRPRCFQVGDLVLKKVEVSKHVGKLDPRWEGPFKVTKVKKPRTYKLQDMEGKDLPRPWNVHEKILHMSNLRS
ncbi:UNVERIFIED_CONTAM: hypothetical protein Slati_2152800 [Sesamum latifolium]|uniref:Integrase zinc-binding domain-containing protein n=1 Tax=Sesamum latifolium TaxID=2727402 RepID=A0AAW2WUA0_9LAMI